MRASVVVLVLLFGIISSNASARRSGGSSSGRSGGSGSKSGGSGTRPGGTGGKSGGWSSGSRDSEKYQTHFGSSSQDKRDSKNTNSKYAPQHSRNGEKQTGPGKYGDMHLFLERESALSHFKHTGHRRGHNTSETSSNSKSPNHFGQNATYRVYPSRTGNKTAIDRTEYKRFNTSSDPHRSFSNLTSTYHNITKPSYSGNNTHINNHRIMEHNDSVKHAYNYMNLSHHDITASSNSQKISSVSPQILLSNKGNYSSRHQLASNGTLYSRTNPTGINASNNDLYVHHFNNHSTTQNGSNIGMVGNIYQGSQAPNSVQPSAPISESKDSYIVSSQNNTRFYGNSTSAYQGAYIYPASNNQGPYNVSIPNGQGTVRVLVPVGQGLYNVPVPAGGGSYDTAVLGNQPPYNPGVVQGSHNVPLAGDQGIHYVPGGPGSQGTPVSGYHQPYNMPSVGNQGQYGAPGNQFSYNGPQLPQPNNPGAYNVNMGNNQGQYSSGYPGLPNGGHSFNYHSAGNAGFYGNPYPGYQGSFPYGSGANSHPDQYNQNGQGGSKLGNGLMAVGQVAGAVAQEVAKQAAAQEIRDRIKGWWGATTLSPQNAAVTTTLSSLNATFTTTPSSSITTPSSLNASLQNTTSNPSNVTATVNITTDITTITSMNIDCTNCTVSTETNHLSTESTTKFVNQTTISTTGKSIDV